MTTVNLGQVQATIEDVLNAVQQGMSTLAGVQSSSVALEISLKIATATGEVYPLSIKVEHAGVVPGMPYRFKTSHHAKTPTQVGPYITSRPHESTVLSAIHTAISTVKTYVDQAITSGHPFDARWLVANPSY